jgi:hypothetical protein
MADTMRLRACEIEGHKAFIIKEQISQFPEIYSQNIFLVFCVHSIMISIPSMFDFFKFGGSKEVG